MQFPDGKGPASHFTVSCPVSCSCLQLGTAGIGTFTTFPGDMLYNFMDLSVEI